MLRQRSSHPTIASLALAISAPAAAPAVAPSPAADLPLPASRSQHALCGALQLLLVLGYFLLLASVIPPAYGWVAAGSGLLDGYLRVVVAVVAVFASLSALPVAAKWVLVGRWRRQEIRLWSLSYVRFWAVKTLVRMNPLMLFAGSPLYVLYLRALGARIGRGVVILTRHVPVCTDLLSIGDRTVVRKDSFITCYRARVSTLETGTIRLGDDVVVGESTVLDIDTSMGDRSRLGHSSSLAAGQRVPAGEHRQGAAEGGPPGHG